MAIKPVILIIENSSAVTGALKSIVRSSTGLRDHFDFIFILPQHSNACEYVKEKGFTVHEWRMIEIGKRLQSIILYLPILIYNSIRIFSFIKKNNIALIVNNDFYNLIPAVYKLFGGEVPYLCYVRFLPSKFPQPLVRVWCDLHEKYAATIITVSQAVKKELPVKSKVVVIGNELPIAPVPYVPANSNVILYCANYIQGKGQEHAIQSFASISARYPEWKLRFVGGDMGLQKNKNFKSDLIRQAERLGINAQIEWNEFQSDISKAYQDSCFVLNFSESESFSLTCLEAQYHGRPVIATRCGGPEEIIEHKVSGILVDLKDIKAMAQAMEYLIINAEERERMAQMAYKSVRTHFGFDNTVGKLLRLYHDVLGSKTEFKMH